MTNPPKSQEPANHIAVFQETSIRRTWHIGEWWFALGDVITVLTDSVDAKQYIKKMRNRDPALDANWGTTCTPLALRAPDGKVHEANCANTEGLFRIIQSIPSPKAKPFKRWLAQVGYERVKDIENPELASTRARARELYQAKGYPQAWIEKRLRSISVRGELTDEWTARGVTEGKDTEGDGSCELIFSNRSAMSYDDLRNYLVHSKDKPGSDARIDWTAIKSQHVSAVNHDQLAGLQMTDAVASSLFFAVNLTQIGEVEDRYFRMLRPTIYRHAKSGELGYGLKFWPGSLETCAESMAHLSSFLPAK